LQAVSQTFLKDVKPMTEQPATFYRYRTFDTFTLNALCHDELHFAHPATFNDPFDCNPTLHSDSNIDQLRTLLSKLIENRVSKEVESALKNLRLEGQKASDFVSKRAHSEAANKVSHAKFMATDPDYSNRPDDIEAAFLKEAVVKELRRDYERGICCFSTTYASPLLWSHYGDQHRGLCVGYNTDRLPKPVLQKVVYCQNRVIKTSMLYQALIDKNQQAKNDLDRDFLLRKSEDWSYEGEWRLIGKQGLQESPLLFTEVTFGLRCQWPVMHAVVRALSGRKNPVRFYKMYETSDKYALDRAELDIDELSAELPRVAVSPTEEFGLADEL
jgi:hypothetical protein